MKQILKSHAYKQWEPQLNQPSMIGFFDARSAAKDPRDEADPDDGNRIQRGSFDARSAAKDPREKQIRARIWRTD